MASTSDKPTKDRLVVKGELSVPIYYEDTDFTGFVYHANYLKFFERAREHLIGIQQLRSLFDAGFHYVVAEIIVRYKYPARHGDNLAVRSSVTITHSPLATFEQEAFLKKPDGSEAIVVTGKVKTVLIDKTGKPCNLPDELFSTFYKTLSNASN